MDAESCETAHVSAKSETAEREAMIIPHKTVPLQVWVDVDIGIAGFVAWLNTIPGIRTHASCQGTIGEGGPHPYRAQVMATWTDKARALIGDRADFTEEGDHWGYIHPKAEPPSEKENEGG